MSEEPVSKRKGPGRPARSTPAERLTVLVPEPLMAEVRLVLLDPTYNRIKYGGLSGLIEELLRGWVEDKRKEAQQDEKKY